MDFQHPRRFIEGGAAGHHVVHQKDAFSAQVLGTGKGTAQVSLAFLEGQFRLGTGFPLASQAAEVERQGEGLPQGAGDFGRLVETPLLQTEAMQGQGYESVELPVGDAGGQCLAEPVGEGELVAVLEGMDQTVEGKVVDVEGSRIVEGWRMGQATPAALAMGGWFGTLRATVCREARQVGYAGRTDREDAPVGPAQDTGRRQNRSDDPMSKSSPDAARSLG